jgi:hypothetical protein
MWVDVYGSIFLIRCCMEVLGIWNFADHFFVDFLGNQRTDSSK